MLRLRLVYAEGKVFIKLHTEVENKNYLYLDKNNQPNLPLTTPFLEKRKNIDRFIVSKVSLSFCMQTLQTLDFLLNLLPNRNIAGPFGIFSPLKFISIQ